MIYSQTRSSYYLFFTTCSLLLVCVSTFTQDLGLDVSTFTQDLGLDVSTFTLENSAKLP